MVHIQRIVAGAAAAATLMIGSIAVAPVGMAGALDCLTAPCPLPTDQVEADADALSRAGDTREIARRDTRGPICLTGPCPPPPTA